MTEPLHDEQAAAIDLLKEQALQELCLQKEETVRELAQRAKVDPEFKTLVSLIAPLSVWVRDGRADFYFVSARGGKQIRRKIRESKHSNRWKGWPVYRALMKAYEEEGKLIDGSPSLSQRELRRKTTEEREAQKNRRLHWRDMNVEQAIDSYLKDYKSNPRRKLSGIETVHRHLGKKLPGRKWQSSPVEAIYGVRLTDLDRHHLTELRDQMKEYPCKANKTIGTLLTALKHAGFDRVIWRRGDKLPEVRMRKGVKLGERRAFSDDEMRAFGQALKDGRQSTAFLDVAYHAFAILALTGFRKSDILGLPKSCRGQNVGLKWGDINFDKQRVRLEVSKSGFQYRYVGQAALQYLESIRPKSAKGGDLVCPGDLPGVSYQGMNGFWKSIILPHIDESLNEEGQASLHSLRHTYASCACNLEYRRYAGLVSSLLGHGVTGVTSNVTKRYVHADPQQLVLVADLTSARIAELLQLSA